MGVRELPIQKYQFKPENIITLLNQEASRENILSVVGDKLGNGQAVKRDDRVFISFAGHGITRKLPSGRDLGSIVPAEAPDADEQDLGADPRAGSLSRSDGPTSGADGERTPGREKPRGSRWEIPAKRARRRLGVAADRGG